MKNLIFNTQICTTKEQSKRLIELGLNSETADMHYVKKTMDSMGNPINDEFDIPHYGNTNSKYGRYVVMNFSNYETLPAWSLHRLIAMLPLEIEDDYSTESFLKIEGSNIVYKEEDVFIYNSFEKDNIYDNIIDCIEWLIQDVYFNKEYLKEK